MGHLVTKGKYDEAERQFKAALSLYRPATSSPLIKAITCALPPAMELLSSGEEPSHSHAASPLSLPQQQTTTAFASPFSPITAVDLLNHEGQKQEELEERERKRLRDELRLSKLGSTDSHGLQAIILLPPSPASYMQGGHPIPMIMIVCQVAACLDHLGSLLTTRGKYIEAFSLHSTSLEMKQKLLGSRHVTGDFPSALHCSRGPG